MSFYWRTVFREQDVAAGHACQAWVAVSQAPRRLGTSSTPCALLAHAHVRTPLSALSSKTCLGIFLSGITSYILTDQLRSRQKCMTGSVTNSGSLILTLQKSGAKNIFSTVTPWQCTLYETDGFTLKLNVNTGWPVLRATGQGDLAGSPCTTGHIRHFPP